MSKTTALICATTLLSLTACTGEGASQAMQTEYAAQTVAVSSAQIIERYPATFEGRSDISIFPQVSGKIESVHVTEGDRVRRGATLFVIDQVPYKAALATAQANLAAAKAEEKSARLSYDGRLQLFNEGVVSEFELKKSEAALAAAQARTQQCEAAVVNARNDLSYTVVTSPCDGVVGRLPFREGALVSPTLSEPLTTVSDNSEMYVYFSMPENSLLAMSRNHGGDKSLVDAMPEVLLYLNDGSEYAHTGRIGSISGVLDKSTGSASVRAVFDNPAGLLRSGGAGNVGIVKNLDSVLLIPQSATYELQDKVYAFKYTGGRAVATRIDAVQVDSKRYAVNAGLQCGDTIITQGVGTLRDGSDVAVRVEPGSNF